MNIDDYRAVRELSVSICQPLETEDYVVQPYDDVSPPKWHLGHTTWFFETVILKEFKAGYKVFDPSFNYLFNSYYEGAGARWMRGRRGCMSRPTVKEIYAYRYYVDQEMMELLEQTDRSEVWRLAEIGRHHEQQHQELLLMDILAIYFHNGSQVAYKPLPSSACGPDSLDLGYREFEGGVVLLGNANEGFCYDNEMPAHQVYLNPYRIRKSCVSNGEYLAFLTDGGYSRPELWLSDGWAWRCSNQISAPEYWQKDDGWQQFTLHGWKELDPQEPVSHVSYYEAHAFAQWAKKRLPTEAEWEHAAMVDQGGGAVYLSHETALFCARQPKPDNGLGGSLWQWSLSDYAPYPGYKPFEGLLGEYNGKFMCNQRVLRGGSFATPAGHFRRTYRNFFFPHQRWQFAGFTLVES